MDSFQTAIRLLTFRLTKQEMLNFETKHFIVGLIGTWIVGMGRYWDDPKAVILQHLGLGSVIYIFVLAAMIWVLLLPFKIKNWSYFLVLTFISLTSFPAIFYGIPVEKIYSIEIANTINVWFLAVVAAWRLALLFYFLKIFTGFHWSMVLVITLVPICLIISILTALNLHRVVFNIMGGVRNPTPHDASYHVLLMLTTCSIVLIGPLLIIYLIGIYRSRKKDKRTS